MKPLILPSLEITAKTFLIGLVSEMLEACGIGEQQRFYGIKINITREATKRICAMNEDDAKKALDSLKEMLKEWKSSTDTTTQNAAF
jgi:hypothetical protein